MRQEPQTQDSEQDSKQPAASPPPYSFDPGPSPAQGRDSNWKTVADAKLGGCALHQKLGQQDMCVTLRSDVKTEIINPDVDWEAHLFVYGNVPRLMREGFHFSEANVRTECSHFILDENEIPGYARSRGWIFGRIYHLMDVSRRGRRHWNAILVVYARKTSVLSKIRLHHLSLDKVYRVTAFNEKSQEIYGYESACPANSFNAIYNDKPLEGWWPWPRKTSD
ncbi:uncharacterized protein HRG_06306 [Hirsutella rhossiliensis]|uniref:Uncharacterized protein n=1 Tax=Hirsutella rhossiliensis TaxID=111463 RepID=A0A9P8MXH4_9HYPO|nr:uncharacterized protein HRG_06306 [Hirsutella rhossiliensis]KAH0962204.1 hypothetical protein HRG_06306 [Hirsutella rhossiliensis]